MTVLAIIFSSIFLSNILLSNLVGLPIIGKESNLKKILVVGVKTLIVAILTALVIYPINVYLLKPENWGFLMPLMTVIVAANLSMVVNMIANKLKVEETKAEFDLITPANAVVIVAVLLMTSNLNFVNSIASVLGISIGYIMITVLVYTLKPKLDLPGIPKAFKGVPILLITLGLIAMIFAGLAGIF